MTPPPRQTTDVSNMGSGVKADLDGLNRFVTNMDQLHTNLMALAISVGNELFDRTHDAFSVDGGANVMPETGFMFHVASHNAGQFYGFGQMMGVGMQNVAMAGQAVAISYSGTDQTSAATMSAVDFAFGDKSKASSRIPPWLVERIPTWSTTLRDHPEAAVVVGPDGVPVNATEQHTDGNTTTTTTTLPDGTKVTTVTTNWAYGPAAASGTTTTTYVNGKEVSSTNSSTYLGNTVRTETAVDPKTGQRQVTSRTDESHSYVDGRDQTTMDVTTYTYDDKGNQSVNGHTHDTTDRAIPAPTDNYDRDSDPGNKAINDLKDKLAPSQPQILAPGPIGDPYGGDPTVTTA